MEQNASPTSPPGLDDVPRFAPSRPTSLGPSAVAPATQHRKTKSPQAGAVSIAEERSLALMPVEDEGSQGRSDSAVVPAVLRPDVYNPSENIKSVRQRGTEVGKSHMPNKRRRLSEPHPRQRGALRPELLTVGAIQTSTELTI